MAARGTEEKEIITNKILEYFKGSFTADKCIRIPINDMEIKVTLTAAKDVLGGGTVPETPKESGSSFVSYPAGVEPEAKPTLQEPSAEEKANLSSLISALGL